MTRYTPRMARFVAEYAADPNATQAAIRAGYSARSAATTAYQLLKTPAVKAAFAAAERRAFDEIESQAERVLVEIARIAFADLRRLFDDNGTLKALNGIDDDTRAGLSMLETEAMPPRRGLRVRRHDKLRALTLLGRHLDLFTPPREAADHGESLAGAIARIRKSLP